nr:aminotransferase class I/II-fold pyridoxal phosphate-dependent enzyme [Klebsiella pneumoniae]
LGCCVSIYFFFFFFFFFFYTGFSAAQVDRLRDEFGVYLIASGRMCVAGLNSRNVQQVAKAFAAVM